MSSSCPGGADCRRGGWWYDITPELWEGGAEKPFLQSSADRHGKSEKGQDPHDPAHSYGGLDSVTDKPASWGGQRNREKTPEEKENSRLSVRVEEAPKRGWQLAPRRRSREPLGKMLTWPWCGLGQSGLRKCTVTGTGVAR